MVQKNIEKLRIMQQNMFRRYMKTIKHFLNLKKYKKLIFMQQNIKIKTQGN